MARFPRIVLAKKIDEGKLGPRDETMMTDALDHACAKGRFEICGKPVAEVPYQ